MVYRRMNLCVALQLAIALLPTIAAAQAPDPDPVVQGTSATSPVVQATSETSAPPVVLTGFPKFMRDYSLPTAGLLLGVGTWLLLPRGRHSGRAIGVILVLISLGLLVARLPLVSTWPKETLLWLLGGITVVSGIGTVSMRSPVYCALWFALALLGTGALFLFVGAQFLGVATVVVYAGAIVVTFLFVLMLAQPQGQAYYDRLSWEPLLSALTGALMVFLLTLVLDRSLGKEPVDLVAKPPTAEALRAGVLQTEHVASIGGELFSRYLIAVEVAGVLLLVALVAASAMLAHHRTTAAATTMGQEEGR